MVKTAAELRKAEVSLRNWAKEERAREVEEVARVVEVGRSGLVLETEVKALLCSGS